MLTVALEKVDFLPATRVTDDTSVLTLKNLVFEPLLRWQPGGLAQPALFSRWTHDETGRRWVFFIREGARFHDGKQCDAEDVIAFIEDILGATDSFGMKWSYARYLAAARITAGAGNTVIVENPEPIADILDIFTDFYICRIAADGSATLGTGRYRVETFVPGTSAMLRRVEAGNGPERIAALAVPNTEVRYRMLRAGQTDVALNLERIEGRLDFDPAFAWGRAVNVMSLMCYLNGFGGVFAAPEARLAVNHAVDRARLVEDVFDGLGIPASTVVSPYHLGMAERRLAPPTFDPDAARRLLDAAGGSHPLTLRTPTFMPDRAPAVARFVAASLEAVGLQVRIETETDRPEFARQVGRKQIGDIAIFDSSPQSTFRVLDDKISSATAAIWWQGVSDAETDRLIAAARRAVAPEARQAAYARCLDRLNAAPPWLYLMHPIDVFAARPQRGDLSIDHKGTLVIG